MGSGTEFSSYFSDEKRLTILRSVVDAYYGDVINRKVIFDTNRKWTSRLALLEQLFPNAKVICCVRDLGWIIDSLERAIQRHPTQHSKLVGESGAGTIYSRADAFMNQDTGIVGGAWCSLREAWFGAHAKKLVVVPYESLVEHPQSVMQKLYLALEEESFQHDYEKIEFSADAFDAQAGTPGLHTVKARITGSRSRLTIPPDIAAKYADTSFWLNGKLNREGVNVLS